VGEGSLVWLLLCHSWCHRTDRSLCYFHVTSVMMPRAPPVVAPSPVLRQNCETLAWLASQRSKPPDVDACPHTVFIHSSILRLKPTNLLPLGLEAQTKKPSPNLNESKSITHHINKPRHKPLGFSISSLMSTLTTPNAQSLNFRLKFKWSTTKWPKTKGKLKNGHLEKENYKIQELVRKRQTTTEKAKKNSTLSLTFSMQTLSVR
jgi:hypothetical protein